MSSPLRLGLQLEHGGPGVDAAAILATAHLAERLGFDAVWLFDHLMTPVTIASDYPYSAAGYPLTADDPFYDPLALIGVLAGATDRLRIGTDVFVAPYRHPIVLGKALATIEQLAPGRVICGLGAGWMREEFAAVDVLFERRGSRLEEYVRALRTVWSGTPSAFAGEFYRWAPAGFRPAPTAPIPIVIGGHADVAMRRAARIGDGWAAIAGPGETPSLVTYTRRLTTIRQYVEEAGRDPDAFEIVLSEVPVVFADRPDPDLMLSGPPELIAERLTAIAATGATMAAILLEARGTELAELAERFMTEVAARL